MVGGNDFLSVEFLIAMFPFVFSIVFVYFLLKNNAAVCLHQEKSSYSATGFALCFESHSVRCTSECLMRNVRSECPGL